ncbi:glycosyltransferase [Neolewinella lacunae]|uniref:Erythromycin biosynthesis protein CIII-like C-terminal domain-containing protein n=1 Tax=Neolewinella lacunae TaxID=1517758 RepID=A0A923PM07_9BACT|nr:nucleotide disphospho-sugar-binding domain-containing protein [Neolewinella lacunae]MBC6996638.1 hypothetical protein [Neolewinella lacunae]MDN3634797.1 glycosyltransferase [Neolewinella lacunae]
MSNQPKVLVFAFDLLAHYTRCLRIAELLEKHFEFIFQESDYDKVVQRQGFKTFPCLRLAEKELVANGCREDVMNWPRTDMEKVMLAQRAAIEHYKPSFVLGDMSPTLSMAAEMSGVKYVSVVNSYLSRYCDVPFEMPDCLPNITEDIIDVPPFYRSKLVDREGFIAVTRSQKEFRFLRRQYGLTKKLNLALELEGDQTWICDSPLFHPIKSELPETVEAIGPLRFFPQGLCAEDIPVRLDKKSIMVTMGSSGNYDFLHKLADPALADYEFLVCGSPSDLELSDNVRDIKFADFNTLIPRVDLVICHGGNGSLYQALAAGKPSLCFPSFFEQRFNSERIAALGWGDVLAHDVIAQDLHAAIETWAGKDLTPIAENIANWESRQQSILENLTGRLLKTDTETWNIQQVA